jgi:hypothetical protein
VVIDEIFCNGPDELDDLQWIEINNDGDGAIDLSDWKLDEGALFTLACHERGEAAQFSGRSPGADEEADVARPFALHLDFHGQRTVRRQVVEGDPTRRRRPAQDRAAPPWCPSPFQERAGSQLRRLRTQGAGRAAAAPGSFRLHPRGFVLGGMSLALGTRTRPTSGKTPFRWATADSWP